MEYEIVIPPPLAELLLTEAAKREISAEEITEEAIKKYMEEVKSFAG